MPPRDASTEDQALIRELRERLSQRRWLVERNWWGNILYHLGHQWIQYDTAARRWRKHRLSPAVPTPITNLFRATIDTVKSAIAQHEPRFLGTPQRDDPRAVAAAASVDTQLQIILKEGKFKTARRRMLDWMLLTGNAFVEVSWDDSEETGMDDVPLEACSTCYREWSPNEIDVEEPQCPNCGSPYLFELQDKFIQVPRGRMRFDTLSPFEVFLDAAIEELDDQPIVMVVQSFTKEQIMERWGEEVEESDHIGATGETSINSRESVASIASGGLTSPLGVQATGTKDSRIVVYRAFIRHHEKYKDGTYICMTAGGKLLEKSKTYPWQRPNKGGSYFPFIHFRFGTAPGRSWGYSPADDLLPKQYQLNKAESLFTLIITRMANPVWLIPANTNPSRITGEIGIQIEYTPVGQAAPARIPGAEAPQSLVKYIQDIRQSFDELSGAFAAVRGRSMGTRTPVGTVQALQERGFGRWATVFAMLEEGYQELAQKALNIWRDNAKTPRVQAIRNAVGGYTFGEFMGADWEDGVDVEVESGSSRPKTQGEKLQTYVQLAQMGVLDFTDDAQKIKMLEDVGLVNMKPGVEEDSKLAFRENSQYMQWGKALLEQLQQQPPEAQQQVLIQGLMQPPVTVAALIDDHAVHFLTHRRLCLTDEFRQLPPQLQSVMYTHMLQHVRDLPRSKINLQISMATNQAAAAQQGGGGMPGPGSGPQKPGGGKPGATPGGGSAHQASTREMQGGESNPDSNP
jgi:hypothetical protein